MPPPADRAGVAIDACVLLNLAAAGVDLADVAAALGPLLVVEQVAAEALWIEDLVGGETVRQPVALNGTAFRALTMVALVDDELPLFVTLARDLDDGEAATLAAARTRGLAVLTDDRKARRVAAELDLEVLSTAQALRQTTDHLGASIQDVAGMLLRVERRSRFHPRREDPEVDWWERSVDRG